MVSGKVLAQVCGLSSACTIPLSRAITLPSANTHMHKTQIHKYTNTNSTVKSNHFAKHKYINAQNTNTQMHKYTNTNSPVKSNHFAKLNKYMMDKQISIQMQKQ